MGKIMMYSTNWTRHSSHERLHQALDDQTPAAVYPCKRYPKDDAVHLSGTGYSVH